MTYLKLILLFARLSIQNDVAYRFDFFMRLFSAVVGIGGELLGLWTIFSNTKALAGWNVYQVVVLLGVFRAMAGVIGMLIAPNMRKIMEDIRQGTLDFVLTKPIDSQFYVSFRQIVLWRAIDIGLGLLLATIGAWNLGASIGLWHIAMFVLLLICGSIIIYSFWLALATTVFWFTRIDNIEMVFWNMFEAGRYPIDIYHPAVRWVLTYFLPLAFLISFPGSALAGKLQPWDAAKAVGAAVVALIAASWYWRYGVRHYSGASA